VDQVVVGSKLKKQRLISIAGLKNGVSNMGFLCIAIKFVGYLVGNS